MLSNTPDEKNRERTGPERPAISSGAAARWANIPASRHNNACGVCFADGHAEIHKWRDPITATPAGKTQVTTYLLSPNSVDTLWLTILYAAIDCVFSKVWKFKVSNVSRSVL